MRILICSALLAALGSPDGCAQDDERQPVPAGRIGNLSIRIRLDPEAIGKAGNVADRPSVSAHAQIEFDLKNVAAEGEDNAYYWPVTSSASGFSASSKPKVRIDGKDTEVVMRPLFPATPSGSVSTPEQRAEWGRRLESWIEGDAQLAELVARYRALRGDLNEIRQLVEDFDREANRHLVEPNTLHSARYVAQGNTYLPHLIRFMPEVDSQLRIDEPYQRWKYISVLSEYDSRAYAPYEQKWREQAKTWFSARPDLQAAAEKMRARYEDLAEAGSVLNGPILRHLHDVRGHNLRTCLQIRGVLQSGRSVPSQELAETLFPDIREELEQESKRRQRLLTAWGFDQSVVSPFTGMLIPAVEQAPGRFDWRDSSVRELVTDEPTIVRQQDPRRPAFAPSILEFKVPHEGEDTVHVQIQSVVPVSILATPFSSGLSFSVSELTINLPPLKAPMPVSIEVPAGIWPVVSPNPHAIEQIPGGGTRFLAAVTEGTGGVHVCPVGFHQRGTHYLDWFTNQGPQTVQELQAILDSGANATTHPLLKMSQYSLLLKSDPLAAHRLSLQIRGEHPEFADHFAFLLKGEHRAASAEKLHQWFEQKRFDPAIRTDDDFARFNTSMQGSVLSLTETAKRELANNVGDLDPSDLSVEQQMGRLYIYCQAGRQTESSLQKLVRLARDHPENTIPALRLLQHLDIEKSSALPFVISQLPADMDSKRLRSDDPRWRIRNAAYQTLRTFETPECAGMLIEFIRSREDSLLIQGAVDAMSDLTLADHFEGLAAITERVARSSESAFMQYLDLLLRSDKARAIAHLTKSQDDYPKLKHRILRALGRAGHRMSLETAFLVYGDEKSSDEHVAAAVSVIGDLADASQVAALPYRAGLEQWMNEQLVEVIRRRGGDPDAFEFVESFYREFVKGNRKHNHLTCVKAFEEIGDPRAIPYLREILSETERKRDAAHAIGKLLLPEHWRPTAAERRFEEAIVAVQRHSEESAAVRDAWTLLLSRPEESFEKMLKYGQLRAFLGSASLATQALEPQDHLYIRRFGNVAVDKLLDAGNDDSLEGRYLRARLLGILLPDAEMELSRYASATGGNPERRLTAQLALKLYRNRR